MIRLFISHSSQDVELTELLVRLLSSALALRSQHIRCTSLDGYRLPGGADSDEQLRDEALTAECFVGILSSNSLSSAYVLFELGARWGAKKHLVPLLGPGMKPYVLRGPLSGLNALSCDNTSELHQLVHEIGQRLQLAPEPPAAYQRHIDAVIFYTKSQGVQTAGARDSAVRGTPTTPQPQTYKAVRPAKEDQYFEADDIIEQHCGRQWPDDFSMQAYCLDQQRQAVVKLREGGPVDIPDEVFNSIRLKCANEWPDDYSMRVYCEEQQVTAFRRVQKTKRSQGNA